jgi:hypothetical protein
MKTHIHSFGAFGLNFTIAYCICHGIVGLERCCWLFVSEFVEDNADVYSLAGDNVKCSEFSLCCLLHYMFYDVGKVEDGAVVGRNIC